MKRLTILTVLIISIFTFAQNQLFNNVEYSLKEAESNCANFLCTQNYYEALQHYNNAGLFVREGNTNATDFQYELNKASALVDKINSDIDSKYEVFDPVVQSRKQAITANGDKYFPKLLSEADKEFQNIIFDYDDGDAENINMAVQLSEMRYNKVTEYSSYTDSLYNKWQPYQNANSALANLLSPLVYSEGKSTLNKAINNLADGNEKSVTENQVSYAGALLDRATINSERFTQKYADVIQARKDAQLAGSETFAADRWSDAEATLTKSGQAFEENEIKDGREYALEAKEKYLDAKNAAMGKGTESESKYYMLACNSWAFSFGLIYPRFISTNLSPTEWNYGGFISLQRNFSEHVGVRLLWNYMNLKGEAASYTQIVNIFSSNLDLLYYFVPCEPISPYLALGFGSILFNYEKNTNLSKNDKYSYEYQFEAGIGAEWFLGNDWKLKTELVYHTPANAGIDGITTPNVGTGILGGESDTYMRFDLGVMYYFSKGEKSKLCDLYSGISSNNSPSIDYDRIEEIVKKYQTEPSENIDYEKIAEIVRNNQTPASSEYQGRWILVGVNFDFGSYRIKPEAYSILCNAAQVLLLNPGIKVEIQGHTDNIDSDSKNMKLSLERAKAVRTFLISKGIADERLTAVGYGSKYPVAENSTELGRSMNRRIEFKIIK